MVSFQRTIWRGFAWMCIALLWLSAPAFSQQSDDTTPVSNFAGEWQTFWRGGTAVVTLEQDGADVTGSYQPDDGKMSGRVEGHVLRGEWEEPGASGTFIFALSDDGQTLTGRYGNGEYWNGFRDEADEFRSAVTLSNRTPRETLRSLLIASNAAVYGGNSRALRRIGDLVTYGEPDGLAIQHTRQRTLMFELLDLSTLRLQDVPETGSTPDADTVGFEIGPSGASVRTEIVFQRDARGRWRLLLPPARTLASERDRFLEALGHDSMPEYDTARANSPRHVMREFIQGTNNWREGGRERAYAVMDLSHIPDRLHELEGPIFADYLKRIIDRVGYVIWQEIPDDPNRAIPYVFFQHPLGNVTIAQVAQPLPAGAEPGEVRAQNWMVTSSTFASAPALFEAMKDLPAVSELEEPRPLSPFFRLREAVRTLAPGLTEEWGYLEIWQWLGIVAALIAAWLAGKIVSTLGRAFANRGKRSAPSDTPPLHRAAALSTPLGTLAAALIVVWSVTRLGITQVGLPFVGPLAGIFLIIAVALVTYRLADLIGGWFQQKAAGTTSYVDEIAASLGTGLTKLMIVAGAIVAIADVAGLPYEGVLTGLGIGGLAIAFAARDTVSNMLGGGILVADRPFNRGDLIEIDGHLATVEQVGLRSTRLRSLDDTVLHVPNAQLSDRVIANWGKRRRRKFVLQVGLTYDTPHETLGVFVQRLRERVAEQPRIDKEDLYVGLKGFGASSIDIEIYSYYRVFGYAAQVDAHNALIMDIIALANEVGVEFAFPTRTLHISSTSPSASDSPLKVAPSP